MLREEGFHYKRQGHTIGDKMGEYAVTGFVTSIDEMYVFSNYKFLIKSISFHIFISSDTSSCGKGEYKYFTSPIDSDRIHDKRIICILQD